MVGLPRGSGRCNRHNKFDTSSAIHWENVHSLNKQPVRFGPRPSFTLISSLHDAGNALRQRLEIAITGRLRCNAVRLLVRHGRWSSAPRSLREHEPRTAKDRCIILLLLLLGLPRLSLVVVAFQRLNCRSLLAHEIDHERHREVCQPVPPREFHNHIQANQVITSIKHSNVAFPAANVDKL